MKTTYFEGTNCTTHVAAPSEMDLLAVAIVKQAVFDYMDLIKVERKCGTTRPLAREKKKLEDFLYSDECVAMSKGAIYHILRHLEESPYLSEDVSNDMADFLENIA